MQVCGLDYLFAIAGAARIVSTEPRENQPPQFSRGKVFLAVFTPRNMPEPSRPPGRRHRVRCRTTYRPDLPLAQADRRFPRDCHQLTLLRFPRYGAVHCPGFVSQGRLLTQRPMLYPVELRALPFPACCPSSISRNPWSGQQDSNLRPSAPKADALPGCAMPRRRNSCPRRRAEARVCGGRMIRSAYGTVN